MRFPRSFSRTNPGTLGNDSVPTAPPSELTMDNCMTSRLSNVNGWPVQRIAVTTQYTGSSMSPGTVAGDLYFWEELTQAWYKINSSSVTLTAGTLSFFDIITLCEPAQRSTDLFDANKAATPGAIEVVLIITNPGSAASNGTYTFAMGPDLTTVGT